MNMFKQPNCQRWALTIVRLVLGSIFILHGGQKVLGLFGGPGLQGFIAWIGTMGVPAWLAYLAAFAEFIGGILMFLGYSNGIWCFMYHSGNDRSCNPGALGAWIFCSERVV